MVRAWKIDNGIIEKNRHALAERTPAVEVSLEDLKQIGVLYWKVDPVDYHAEIAKVARERDYAANDTVTLTKESTPPAMLEKMFTEHLHEDEEIRYIIEGAGFFDVRNLEDEWVRIHVVPGDLIIIPARRYHRFTLDEGLYVKAYRLFKDNPVWTAINRVGQ